LDKKKEGFQIGDAQESDVGTLAYIGAGCENINPAADAHPNFLICYSQPKPPPPPQIQRKYSLVFLSRAETESYSSLWWLSALLKVRPSLAPMAEILLPKDILLDGDSELCRSASILVGSIREGQGVIEGKVNSLRSLRESLICVLLSLFLIDPMLVPFSHQGFLNGSKPPIVITHHVLLFIPHVLFPFH
jgi:hypothetical protein